MNTTLPREDFEGRLKDIERRMNTVEEQHTDLLTSARHAIQSTATDEDGSSPMVADGDTEKRLSALERGIKRLQARVKDVETDEPESKSPGFSMPNPFSSEPDPKPKADPKK
jgi:uncharacterized protein YceH (UPF0502 family)